MRAHLYDGLTAVRHDVVLAAADGALDIHSAGEREQVPAAALIALGGDRTSVRIGRSDRPGWRLVVPAGEAEALRALLPVEPRYGRWVDRIGLWPAAAAFGVVAGLVLLTGHLAPQWLAPHIPQRWENDLGKALVGDFGANRCSEPAGNRALARLTERVAPGALAPGASHISVTALDYRMFNAAALPGAQIIVFRGLIRDTGDPAAIAGVLAHEIAHVRRRHVTQSLIRELGIGSIIRLFAGGIGANSEQLVALSFTRANEEQADADAIAMLRAAQIDPRPTARLFAHLAAATGEKAGKSGGYADFLSSHPVNRDRARRFAASYDPKLRYLPVLGAAQTGALLGVCGLPAKR